MASNTPLNISQVLNHTAIANIAFKRFHIFIKSTIFVLYIFL